MAVKSDGSLWSWGNNYFGQLGNGTNMSQNVPLQVGNATDWQQTAAEDFTSAAIKTDGSLWNCGWNIYGQLGNGTYTDSNTPVEVACPISSIQSPLFPPDYVQIYPNPAQNFLIIQMAGDVFPDLTFDIRNILQEVIFSPQNLTNLQRIDLSGLPRGGYILCIRSANRHLAKQFFICP